MSRFSPTLSSRTRVTAILLAGFAVAITALVPTRAVAAKRPSTRTLLSLVSPRNDSSTRVDTRTLVVRLRAAGPDFRARLNGRDVSSHFGRAIRGVRSARFVRGRDFSLGRGSFMAAVGPRGSRQVRTVGFSFTAWRFDARPLVFHRRPREPAGGGELSALTIDVISDAHVTGKRIWINGRQIRDHLRGLGDASHPIAHGCGCHLDLGANHGLRFGPNRVTVQYSHAGWSFQRTTRVFRIARTAPLPGAGQDRLVSRRTATMLNASSSRPARPGDRLLYHWRIVSRPRGGHARVLGSRRMRAQLIAKTPGSYRVRLQVTETGSRSRAATATAGGTPSPVTPTPDPVTPTPAPLMPIHAKAVDEVDVGVTPSDDPMGFPIDTITSSGAIQVGPNSYPIHPGSWMQILVLSQLYPTSVPPISDNFYTPQQLKQAETMISKLPAADDDLVIVSVPTAEPLVYPTPWAPNVKANFDYKSLQSIVSSIGGVAATPDGWSTLSNEPFSIIGQVGTPVGQAWQSSGAAAGSSQQGSSGSLDGYLQTVTGDAYSYVSPQYLPIDTEAQGSDGYTHNVIAVGGQSFDSDTISNGDTGAQLVVLDSSGTHPLAQVTFTLINGGDAAVDGSAGDPVSGNYGTGVKGLAATLAYFDRTMPSEALVIVQTFGQGQWYANTPNGSPSWVNDDLNAADLGSWDGGTFVKSDGTDNANNALYGVWNPGYPTVAGQIGSLTSGAGHDIVAGFGNGQDNNGTPNGGLTVVASTHPFDGRQNFVQGQTGQIESNPRMVGTLTRTKQGQWTVQTASDSPAFAPSQLWQTAFAAPQPWPYTAAGQAPNGTDITAAQAQQYQAADSYIAGQLWPNEGITDVRAQYVAKKSDDWDNNAERTQSMIYPASQNPGFSPQQFSTLQGQLVTEMGYVAQIKNLVSQWQQIFNDNKFDGYVDLQGIARTVVDNAQANNDKFEQQTADLSWLDITSHALAAGSSILGFTPAAELAEPMGLVANVLGLASASMSSEGNQGGSRFDSAAIWDRSDQLGVDLVQRMNKTTDALDHIEDLFLGNWAKLQPAGQNASGAWAYGTTVERTMKQALAVTTTQEFYEALLPLTYQQWVINPNATGASDDPQWGPSARALPGRAYRCWSDDDHPYPSPPRSHPFAKSPNGGLSFAGVHGYNPPASTTPPAAANQSWYALRVLKSVQNPMQIKIDPYRGNNPTIWHAGSNPPAGLVNGLFEPIDPADDSGMPTQLGLNKTTFFGDYGNGWGWRKAVCS